MRQVIITKDNSFMLYTAEFGGIQDFYMSPLANINNAFLSQAKQRVTSDGGKNVKFSFSSPSEAQGVIRAYEAATRNGFRPDPDNAMHLHNSPNFVPASGIIPVRRKDLELIIIDEDMLKIRIFAARLGRGEYSTGGGGVDRNRMF